MAILGDQHSRHAGAAFRGGWIFVTVLVLLGAATALRIHQQKSHHVEGK